MDNISQHPLLGRFYRLPKKVLILLAGVLAIVFVVIVLVVIDYVTFHVVSTDPSMDNFPDLASTITITFNHPLNPKDIQVSFYPAVGYNAHVSGKQLEIDLSRLLSDGSTYTLTLNCISSNRGQRLGATSFHFTVKYIPYDQLPSNLQTKIFSGQDHSIPTSRNSIPLNGTDELLNQGLSAEQVDALRQALYLYGQSTHQTIVIANIMDSTVETFLPLAGDTSGTFTMKFEIIINHTTYKAVLLYVNTTIARLQLYSTSNYSSIYDSGNIDDSQL